MSLILLGDNGVTFPNSTVQASAGSVIQLVNATYATTVTNSTATYADTGLTATITPKFATSKILVLVHQNGVAKTTNPVSVRIRLVRNSTEISSPAEFAADNGTTATNSVGSVSTSFLDNPATTSATTYKTQFLSNGGNNTTFVQYASGSCMSTITLMEIAA
jgi:hypothetical protein